MNIMRRTIRPLLTVVIFCLGAAPLAAQTEFPALEEALSHVPELARSNIRHRLEKQIRAKPGADLLRELYVVIPIELQLSQARERFANYPDAFDKKAGIVPLDISSSMLNECHDLLTYPNGYVRDKENNLSGLKHFFQCPDDGTIIKFRETAWQAKLSHTSPIRELTTTDLDVGGIRRRAILVRHRDPKNNAVTSLTWRHSDRFLQLEITGIDAEQEQRLRDIARSFPH